MHVPDHFLDKNTSIALGAVAIAAVATAATRARRELLSPDLEGAQTSALTRAAFAGAVTAGIFAVQMLNFPVASGTSGHLIGGAVAAALLGPWTAVLSLAVVLGIQGLVFADGGLTALGTNVTLMSVVAVATGWAVTRLILSRSTTSRTLPIAAAVGAAVSVPLTALAFTGFYAIGGTSAASISTMATQMVGVHALIGLGEALITGVAVAAVMAANPSLVYAARLHQVAVPARVQGPWATVTAVALVATIAATAIARFASPHPDGLEFVSESLGFDVTAGAHALGTSLFADYGDVHGLDVGVAGILGVALVAALTFGAAALGVRGRTLATQPA